MIKVEELSKRYTIGHSPPSGDGLRHRLEAAFRSPWQWLSQRRSEKRSTEEELWALSDVSFRIRQGESVGIVGRNGAGKSTLLKILSRITEPTRGRVRLRGRVAALLEVGTGFHAELTGRENIFLNGAILGMPRTEIRRKFDEIVAFAEIERFLDTPVKRYSSGMYVRLAFAVAAHLEPDVLIVDEVLAVGDQEFQKKCLGKMHEVSAGEGRTVLFVSHNIAAIKSLTTRALLFQQGRLIADGRTDDVLAQYMQLGAKGSGGMTVQRKGVHTSIEDVRLLDAAGEITNTYTPGADFNMEVTFTTDGTRGLSLELFLMEPDRTKLAMSSFHQFQGITLPDQPGTYVCQMALAPLWLASGEYTVEAATSVPNQAWDHWAERAVVFEVPFSNPKGLSYDFRHASGNGTLAWVAAEPPKVTPVVHAAHPGGGR